jgi:hypothetical protein
MIGPRIDLALATRAHHVAGAILVGAKKRTAFLNALFLCRLGWIEWHFRALRVSRDVACRGKLFEIIGAIPVAAPLPDVASHVVEAVAVRRESAHRRSAREAILTGVLDREYSLVGVRHELPVRLEFIAPRIELAAQASSRGKLPRGFRRQSLARPFRVANASG